MPGAETHDGKVIMLYFKRSGQKEEEKRTQRKKESKEEKLFWYSCQIFPDGKKKKKHITYCLDSTKSCFPALTTRLTPLPFMVWWNEKAIDPDWGKLPQQGPE
ncbi:hypothetical protein CDAR_26791 [Caerostris darwini]|uniref:Uncharacterized protein n=1 Tax=Caerostris darwini TaxID=1538125 RepID=A0AAV4PVM2_9ARAC|nr:hypothetical protein CDAR_26791 [Caerostris darwini]